MNIFKAPGGQSVLGASETVSVSRRGWLRRLFSFVGPAYLVSVGYMDPGNWATDIEGGARFGYTLIWVLLMSNIMAVLLQALSSRLGIVTGFDLAQGCRREYPRPVRYILWFLAEIAIAATDLAEALGTIIGLNLLFGLPLLWGCLVTAFDTFLLLAIQRLGVRKMEALIIMLVATIGISFIIEVYLASPDWGGIASGFIPHLEPGALYIAIGIIGATVMPHNLYLHSSLVQSRAISSTHTGKTEACKFNLIDSAVALNAAFFVNAAILVMSAANFHSRGILVTEIQQAHSLLDTVLGSKVAPVAFALALLAAGQSSTLTGTISGQVVMEGFLNIKMRPWLRRLLTRSIALIPAVIVIAIMGGEGTYELLILSQVILSLQLPFAVIPLIHFTSDRNKMGNFVNKLWVKIIAWTIAAIIVALNLKLVASELSAWFPSLPVPLTIILSLVLLTIFSTLIYITFAPIFRKRPPWKSGILKESERISSLVKPGKIERIGVALEHSNADSTILSFALSTAKAHHGRLILIHITETPGTLVYGQASDSLHGREDIQYLEELARELEEQDLAVEIHWQAGKPVNEIIKAATALELDMLILGSHGHQGLKDLVYGQVVDAVRHGVKIPVMVVRVEQSSQEKPQK